MTRKTLDPNLASILDSIRATVGGEAQSAQPPVAAIAEPEPEPEDAGPAAEPAAKPAKAARNGDSPAVLPEGTLSAGSRTVEEFLAELIRPQVDAWLKANLPELIQKMAAEEIARLTGGK
jgi:cell pole-organizing protein PopZ